MSNEYLWTADEVFNLNHNQNRGVVHPFTCPNRDDGEHREFNGDLGALVATRRGWICPWCNYTQDWAHEMSMQGAVVGFIVDY